MRVLAKILFGCCLAIVLSTGTSAAFADLFEDDGGPISVVDCSSETCTPTCVTDGKACTGVCSSCTCNLGRSVTQCY
jgi:hypothetical protein